MTVTKEMLSSVPFQYAKDVLDGKLVTGHRIKQACERFFRWIDEAEEKGFYLDHQAGMQAINFFPTLLNHTKGKMAGQPFVLAGFQQFTMYNVFGWKKRKTEKLKNSRVEELLMMQPEYLEKLAEKLDIDPSEFSDSEELAAEIFYKEPDLRRIKTVYDKRAKKNGKSAEMAGVALLGMSFDGESEAEVYVGATKEEQAKICWKQAKSFVDSRHANRLMKSVLKFRCKQKEIWCDQTDSVLMPLGGDSKTQDGINSHISIIDEYHAHKDDSVKENLESSSVNRSQPITWHITTAGVQVHGVCKNYENVCKEILDGSKQDDSLWIMIHDLDEGDDWEDEANWIKANPLLGQGLSIDRIRDEYGKAKNQPSKIPNFQTKHLNMWVDAPEIRISDEIWMQNAAPVKLSNFGPGAVIGLDLSTTTDLTAAVLVSEPDADGFVDLLPLIFCPLDTIEKRSKQDRVPYRAWKDLKLKDYLDFSGTDHGKSPFLKFSATCLIATPGNQIDYEQLEVSIKWMLNTFQPKWVNYDRFNATQLVQNLTAGGTIMNPFAQTVLYYSAPTKEFERLAHLGKLRHGGHPILRWMISGCVAKIYPNEDIRYDKSLATKRIDGIIASIMGLAGTQTEGESNESQWNNVGEDNFV